MAENCTNGQIMSGMCDDGISSAQLALAITWSVLLGFFTILCVFVLWKIQHVFYQNPKHRNYLLFFALTIFGSLLLCVDRLLEMYEVHDEEYISWYWYLFGQNLLVSPELVRASRLAIVYYGHPGMCPPRWVRSTEVKSRKLNTTWMFGMVALLNVPVLILYILMSVFKTDVYDYIAVGYFVLEILLMFALTYILWKKKTELKKYQLSETYALITFGTLLFAYVIIDNIRYYGFEVREGENATTEDLLPWFIIDIVALSVFTLLVFAVWRKHYTIMYGRDFTEGNFTNTDSSDKSEKTNQKGSQIISDVAKKWVSQIIGDKGLSTSLKSLRRSQEGLRVAKEETPQIKEGDKEAGVDTNIDSTAAVSVGNSTDSMAQAKTEGVQVDDSTSQADAGVIADTVVCVETPDAVSP